jgi:hypothetical protein
MILANDPSPKTIPHRAMPRLLGSIRTGRGLPLAAAGMVLAALAVHALGGHASADEPPAISPFGPRTVQRDDALPGYVETSDGKTFSGRIYLTRDTRLEIYDEAIQRQREVPLRVVKQIECRVVKEWIEREWRFRELTRDEKYYTGRSYPAREYVHTITLQDGRTITGPLSAIVYVQPEAEPAARRAAAPRRPEPLRFLLHKRQAGEMETTLEELVYTRWIVLGEEALAEAREK